MGDVSLVKSNYTGSDVTSLGELASADNAKIPGTVEVVGHTKFEGITSTGATGTGKIVYDTSPTIASPTFTTPALGTPASGVLDNCTAATLKATSNSLVIKPTTDATTAIQMADKDGNAILNIDTTNDRVGIGTASPGAKLSVVQGSASTVMELLGDADDTQIKFINNTNTVERAALTADSNNNLQIAVYGSERMRITSTGNVGIGTTDFDGTPAIGRLTVKGTTTDGSTLIFVGRDSGETNVITIDTDGDILNSAGVYGTLSDAKLKENIVDATDKLADIMKIKIRNYNLKRSGLEQTGIVAQELREVFPSLVTEIPDMEKVPDLDWTPKTLQKAVTQKVSKTQEEIKLVDGKYTRVVTVIEVDEPVYDNVDLYDKSGKIVGTHKVPVVESYTEDESLRPMIVRPTGTVTLAIKQSLLIPLLVKAVQELTKRVNVLEANVQVK